MLFGKAVQGLVGNAQAIFAFVPGAAASAASTHILGEQAPGAANQTSADNLVFDSFFCYELVKAAGAVAVRMQQAGPTAPLFHSLVDPAGPVLPMAFIFEDFIAATITALACETVFGFHEHITLGDKTTLVGVGFRAGADHIWHSFVNDCPTGVAPVTVRRDTTLTPLSTTFHRLTIVIDGRTKTIYWFIDDVLVDSWVPGAALDLMGPTPGPKCLWSMTCPINGAGKLRVHAGGIPQLRLMNLTT